MHQFFSFCPTKKGSGKYPGTFFDLVLRILFKLLLLFFEFFQIIL